MRSGKATATSTTWCARGSVGGGAQGRGLKLEVIRLEGRTPVILFEVPATKAGSTGTVVMYGHLDKQPEFNGWRNDLGPWTPKLDDGLLYGRGGADDGYAVFAAITAIEALDAQRHRAAALRGPDRELRRKWLVRSAGLPRCVEAAPGRCGARRAAWTRVPATTTSCGSPP